MQQSSWAETTSASREWSAAESTPHARPTRLGAGAIATVVAVLLYFTATGIEILLIHIVQPTEIELAWISEAILALAFGFAVFLWLHLKWTQMTLSRLERDHIVLDTQLSLAAEIQRGLLPATPPDEAGLHWAARLVQAGQVGGDLYDVVRLEGHSWLLLVGDVSGKGVPAALVLASIRTMFRMLTAETSDPGALVERISQRLHEDYAGMPYLTCVVVRIDPDHHELAYVNAGHPAGIVATTSGNERSLLLESSGPPAGLFPGRSYTTQWRVLPAGAVLILVTDGITEALDSLGATETDPARKLLSHVPRPISPARLADALIERTSPALTNGEEKDDRTVVAVALDG